MPHIHTQPGQHDHTASVYLFRTDFDQPKVILHLHKKFGTYMQFGGHIELHENPWQAVAHELREESGYDIHQVQLLQPHERLRTISNAAMHPVAISHSTHAVPEDHFHTDSAYTAITTQDPAHHPDDGESIDIQLFTRDELAALPKDKIFENVREIALYVFDTCLDKWNTVSPDEFK